ncbi:hypothetical protein M0654_00045 [Rhizobium sp. NTR19]|uniref:Uncharacterized protein n=1 Tax=Neorhizobium turbinariae TaxID=2937795 RepID=A0ABT0IKH2_9HYPH|nr:hypothetical protein [Neorhizobium turbinariae]MCK8778360.1 hypothetical protein [Neorhizobium turbinariae]
MRGAKAYHFPSLPFLPQSLWRPARSFVNRLLLRHVWSVPDLPKDLHGDVGLGEELPAGRMDAFCSARRGSAMRNLPF